MLLQTATTSVIIASSSPEGCESMIQQPTLSFMCIHTDITKVVAGFVRKQLTCNAIITPPSVIQMLFHNEHGRDKLAHLLKTTCMQALCLSPVAKVYTLQQAQQCINNACHDCKAMSYLDCMCKCSHATGHILNFRK